MNKEIMPRPHDFLAQQTLTTPSQTPHSSCNSHGPQSWQSRLEGYSRPTHQLLGSSVRATHGVFFKLEGYSLLSAHGVLFQQLQNKKIKPKKSILTTRKSSSVTEPRFRVVARFLPKYRVVRFLPKIAILSGEKIVGHEKSRFFVKAAIFRWFFLLWLAHPKKSKP